MSFEPVENDNSSAGGAGVLSARLVAGKGVRTVLTGSCGPVARRTLGAAGIDVIEGCGGTVSEVVDRFKSGQHQTEPLPDAMNNPSTGRGGGRGVGGGGRGTGGGGGRGMGMGGRGMGGRGMGRGGRGQGRGSGR